MLKEQAFWIINSFFMINIDFVLKSSVGFI